MHTIETPMLFDSPRTLESLGIPDADIRFVHDFFVPLEANDYFKRLTTDTSWTQPVLRVWGKDHLQPRLSCWYGDPDAVYRFSGKTFRPHPWTPALQCIRHKIQGATGFHFNSVLLNLYRDGHDSIGMHSDNEPELGPMPVIASLSLGATRIFRLKHRHNAFAPVSIALSNGSLLIMAGQTQERWMHGVRKDTQDIGPRINLTFRRILTA
ncbi:alpha-ketoglutarate-dependent dioxygenase AlkB [Oxalobacteraceae bacterium R-40]|uniref:Alpha-ketoglutarate-dependent dioxygenase AlkB n=1 Tax=Keguizhuia sedimenti TaxID=3064264 RepID=A0ABU1BS99_9BURK|nr:alpha-ketoglutarate-dependent dioxygenase AlkB [Oxalobacteraceae bacterium R-40]